MSDKTISKDLFLAVLAMDSYNRGYGQGIVLTDTKLGTATILEDSEDFFRTSGQAEGELYPAAASGFYAIAFTVGEGVEGLTAGTTVISYRGTDTIFRGERGVAGWLKGENALPNAKGFGSMPSLTVSASNDFELAETLKRAA